MLTPDHTNTFPHHYKGNCMGAGMRLDDFAHLELSPVRNASTDPDNTDVEACGVDDGEFWTIYGRNDDGEAMALHDAQTAPDAAQWLHDAHEVAGLPVMLLCHTYGVLGRHTNDVAGLAECLTECIVDDIPDLEDVEARIDDFDNHPLAEMREALVDVTGMAG